MYAFFVSISLAHTASLSPLNVRQGTMTKETTLPSVGVPPALFPVPCSWFLPFQEVYFVHLYRLSHAVKQHGERQRRRGLGRRNSDREDDEDVAVQRVRRLHKARKG